eukprot:CAMPEP_0197315270 /NCGR_PEP_ID=MMETSP0891-20130614/37430_1 /TAXON_ID=44058 ORGANISM="Aureoumbra lagunensis, Strain CCMP1510" /NCGR_SAMPLE_ID=MMETSP0891 /ASSEMBLY_ACC=CAM_ASM_000534 /LENGTH=891 /DNA_ID=CAMNT_0042804133 /DNA_START=113 /DNA_END=2789 /DNA_ORIENTATION=+
MLFCVDSTAVQNVSQLTTRKAVVSEEEEEKQKSMIDAVGVATLRSKTGEIEKKWQEYWAKEKTFKAERTNSKEKKYVLDMFPYPSGSGLHVGHPAGYTASDAMARYWRHKGYDVLHCMGWDAFGLPAEQHAIQTGTHPALTTQENIQNFKRQLRSLGFAFDWDRELATTDDDYVKWTQFIFLKFLEQGLAEQREIPVNWCPELGTVLANEEIIDGKSERGGYPVVRTPLRQWVLKITEYADPLLDGLNNLEWPTGTKVSQTEWIGKSFGASIIFETLKSAENIQVFTTRPDTLFGVTHLVLAPEHPAVSMLCGADQRAEVDTYINKVISMSDLDRTANLKKKPQGVFLGAYAKHPLTQELLPIWISEYVLATYGTGAVMAVPAHDDRDFTFAQHFGLPIKPVVFSTAPETNTDQLPFTVKENTEIRNSHPQVDGKSPSMAAEEIIQLLGENGKKETRYKLRDWVFSRQRYWGEPIPVYFPVLDANGEAQLTEKPIDLNATDTYIIDYSQPIAVDISDLPLTLPELDDFSPGDDPQGALARAKDWRFFVKDGLLYARETNTMPQWAGSCWYYLRFADNKNADQLISAQAEQDWLPVDLYVGGSEHAVLHLLYARFWHKFLKDVGILKTDEPFQKLVHQGMILGSDGEKMSKSRGNVVNPDHVVAEHGADALRLYEMFMGPLEASKPWQTSQLAGVVRFRDRVYQICAKVHNDSIDDLTNHNHLRENTQRILHQTMRKVTHDFEVMAFNTAISALMVLSNHLSSLISTHGGVPREACEALIIMVSPFAPHLAEECWTDLLGNSPSVSAQPWVTWSEEKCKESTITIAVQINGKTRTTLQLAPDATKETALQAAFDAPELDKFLHSIKSESELKKVIYVPSKILNLVLPPPAKK